VIKSSVSGTFDLGYLLIQVMFYIMWLN